MITIEKKQVPEPFGSEKILDELLSGDDLAHEVYKHTPSFEKLVFTYAPESATDSMLVEFDKGGLCISKNNEVLPWKGLSDLALQKELFHQLNKKRDHWLILTNPLVRSGDQWLEHRKSKIAIYQNQILHILESSDTQQIVTALEESAATISAIIFLLKESPQYADGHKLTKSELKAAAANTVAVISRGQYDGESFLIQRRLPS
ncbi:hypothetical protein [Bdellovibrio sp.]|uniref:hypothetical protein n=1 Tax=Bdellovibrio TaxID=958 RepID=UPI003221BC42